MKLKFIVNKWANFYFLLHNLAECQWPWPYRKPYNDFWKKTLGPFSTKEKKALKDFKDIYQKHFLKIYIGRPFFEAENPWKSLKSKLSSQDTETLRKIFSAWKTKFEKIWKKESLNLLFWKEALEKEMENPERKSALRKIMIILSKFYNTPLPQETIKVFLMLSKKPSSKKYASGIGGERGRGLETKNIVLIELSQCPITKTKVNYAFGVVLHEIIHCCFAPKYLIPLLKREIKNEKEIYEIEEIINRSLVPTGIIGKDFFNIPLSKTLSRGFIKNVDIKQTEKILKLSKQYIQKKEKTDKNYIRKIKEILK